MRFLALLVGLVAALGGSYGAFAAMRAVGPGQPHGRVRLRRRGDGLARRRRPVRVRATSRRWSRRCERELGPEALISYLSVKRTEATATARSATRAPHPDRRLRAARGRAATDKAEPARLDAGLQLDPAAIDASSREAQKRDGRAGRGPELPGQHARVERRHGGGEPDAFVANLDGGGLRLPGEPNPVRVGAAPDSLLRAENLAKVIAAARKAAPAGARVTDFDIRPGRVSLRARDAAGACSRSTTATAPQLTSRDLAAKTRRGHRLDRAGSSIDPEAVERMARAANKALRQKLADVQYVLLDLVPRDEQAVAAHVLPRRARSALRRRGPPLRADFTWPGRG